MILTVLMLVSCNNGEKKPYKYPKSKLWKHGVYSKYQAKELEGVFKGLEVDVIYSPEKNDIYVGRVVADTAKNQTLDDWFSVLRRPRRMSYWIDFKNLNAANAEQAYLVLDNLVAKYRIRNKFFIESQNVLALKMANERNYHTMLWVEKLHYRGKKNYRDTLFVMNKIREQINELHPDAISCEYTMFPLLCDTFPEQNIHFWHTPKEYTPENVEYTKKLCENPSVKVVLVDYPTPDVF